MLVGIENAERIVGGNRLLIAQDRTGEAHDISP
jgi:hypothetical protein